ncbi:hypothetical protein V3C99_018289 [Haemonchus contortus]
MVNAPTFTRVLLACFCYAILSSYVIAFPTQFVARPSFDNEVTSWKSPQLSLSEASSTHNVAVKRAMMRLGKRLETYHRKRAIMRLGK